MLENIVSHLKNKNEKISDVFCSQLTVPFVGLSVMVDPLGVLVFPLTEKAAKSLIVEAEPARYGLKDQTLLDRNVRDTWEIPKHRVQSNEKWNSMLSESLMKLQKNLNLSDDGVLTAELHNLLIYMPGQFFKSHQDSEKADGMIATLVVLLPSQFTGGELVVDQHGDKQTFDFSNNLSKNLILTAFYADCYHEIKEVKSGYRVALTYNLFFKSNHKKIELNRNLGLEVEIKNYFTLPLKNGLTNGQMNEQANDQKQNTDLHTPNLKWLVYLLDHEYTQSSLDWFNLRGLDRKRLSEFLACAEQLGLTAHLALADVREVWNTESDGYYGGYRGRRRWRDDVEETDVDASELQLTELIEDSITLKHWVSRAGQKFDGSNSYVSKDIVCWTKAVDQFKPFKSEYEGYMGNYGNTLDRWYHRAAIVLWKEESHLLNLFRADKTETVRHITELIYSNSKKGLDAVKKILPHWPKDMGQYVNPSIVLKFAVLINEPEIAAVLVKSCGLPTLKSIYAAELMSLIELYGEEWMTQILNSWRTETKFFHQNYSVHDTPSLIDVFGEKHKKVCHWILQDQFLRFVEADTIHGDKGAKWIRENQKEKIEQLQILLNSAKRNKEMEIHNKLVQYALKSPVLYDQTELAKMFINYNDPLYFNALEQLQEQLKKLNLTPRKRDNWSILDNSPHNCSDCTYLKNFLVSASTQKLVWPLAKDRRAHMHQIIDEMDIPVTHETIHQGSPHKLVLTKTMELFKSDKLRIELIQTSLEKIRKTMDNWNLKK